jgi:glycosyltransferase involved in cell wall biosynthesis
VPEPLVSIVIVSYNQADFIGLALAGCVRQRDDYPNIEIIVADDGSTDGTRNEVARWIRDHPGLIRLVGSTVNRGIAANFNAGLEAAQGAYLAWLGGDDIMLPGKIVRQVAVLEADRAASGCYHDAEVFSWPQDETLGLFSRLYGGRAFTVNRVDARRMLDPRVQMLPSTLLLRRDRMPSAFDGRFRFHNDYIYDFEMIATGGPYVRMEGVYVRYRKHARSIGRDEAVRTTVLEENLMALGLLTARFPRYAKYIRRRAAYYLILEALKNFHAGDRSRARHLLHAASAQGAPLKAMGLSIVGPYAAMLTDPRHRGIAMKLRSLLS